MPLVANLHHFDVKQDPGPHPDPDQNEKSDPGPHQSKKPDPRLQ
jgi:hypothetical protein